jgi:hypothetical protein
MLNTRFRGWVKPAGSDLWAEVVQGANVSQVLQRLKALPYSDGEWQISINATPVPSSLIGVMAQRPLVGNFKEFNNVRSRILDDITSLGDRNALAARVPKLAICT